MSELIKIDHDIWAFIQADRKIYMGKVYEGLSDMDKVKQIALKSAGLVRRLYRSDSENLAVLRLLLSAVDIITICSVNIPDLDHKASQSKIYNNLLANGFYLRASLHVGAICETCDISDLDPTHPEDNFFLVTSALYLMQLCLFLIKSGRYEKYIEFTERYKELECLKYYLRSVRDEQKGL